MSQFIRPTLLEDYKNRRPGACRRLLSLGEKCCSRGGVHFLVLASEAGLGFRSCGAKAQPPLLPSFLEDRGPWPLPFYPVLGLFPSDGSDYHKQPLPVWIGDFTGIYPSPGPERPTVAAENTTRRPLARVPLVSASHQPGTTGEVDYRLCQDSWGALI